MKLLCHPAEVDLLAEHAAKFEIVAVGSMPSVQVGEHEFYLRLHEGILRLCQGIDDQGVWVDPREIDRRLKGDFLLGRACGVKRGLCLEILDATAGLGVDGLALFKRGQHVHLVERDPALGAMLGDLLRRLGAADVELSIADSSSLLRQSRCYDVVYLDPMFAARRKSALPVKRMQYLSALLTDRGDFDETVIPLAQNRARNRVVLKRRAKDPVTLTPDWTIRGRAVRYDVYRGAAITARGGGQTGTPG